MESLLLWMSEFIMLHLHEGIFLAALIETIVPPIPTLAIFPTAGFMASKQGFSLFQVFPLILLGGAGATIGSTGIFFIAKKLGRLVLIKYLGKLKIREAKLLKVEKWFERHGDKAVFFGRLVPVMREMISIPAGLLNMKFTKFVLFTFLGSCAWSAITILIGYYFGEGLELFF